MRIQSKSPMIAFFASIVAIVICALQCIPICVLVLFLLHALCDMTVSLKAFCITLTILTILKSTTITNSKEDSVCLHIH